MQNQNVVSSYDGKAVVRVMPNKIDALTGSAVVLPHVHSQIHDGNHYYFQDHVELADTGIQDYLITTPDEDNLGHFKFALDGSTITQFELYEGTDKTGTTEQTPRNNNRSFPDAATIKIHKGISGGTTDGTRIKFYKSGSSTNQAKSLAISKDDEELDLNKNTKYIVRITSGAASNLCNVGFFWYKQA